MLVMNSNNDDNNIYIAQNAKLESTSSSVNRY